MGAKRYDSMNDMLLLFILCLVFLLYLIKRAAYIAAIDNQKAYEDAKKKAQKNYINALYGRD
jgi:Ca2+/Na+ antiporter